MIRYARGCIWNPFAYIVLYKQAAGPNKNKQRGNEMRCEMGDGRKIQKGMGTSGTESF